MSFFDNVKHKLKKAFIMGGVVTTTLTASAEAKEPQSEMNSDAQTQAFQNNDSVKETTIGKHKPVLEADNQAERDVMNTMLNDYAQTEKGKDLLNRVSPDLTIRSDEKSIPNGMLASYDFTNRRINIPSDTLKEYHKNKGEVMAALSHEVLHDVQRNEGRRTIDKLSDGIDAHGDYTLSKLSEIETNLHDAMNQKQFGHKEFKPYSDFYDSLKEKARKNPYLKGNEAAIERVAKTDYVKTLWESTPEKTNGPKEFKDWAAVYNAQALHHTYYSPESKANPSVIKEQIQKYIDSMGVDLKTDYFSDTKHTQSMNPQERQFFNAKAALDNKEYNQLKTSAGRLAYRHWLNKAMDTSFVGEITANKGSDLPRKDLTKLLNETKAIEESILFDNPQMEASLTPELEKKENAAFQKGFLLGYSNSDRESKLADSVYTAIESGFSKFQMPESAQAKSNGGFKNILRAASHQVPQEQKNMAEKITSDNKALPNRSVSEQKAGSLSKPIPRIPLAILQKSGGR